MKYRVSVNGKRKSREQVSRDRYIERVQAEIEIAEEVTSQTEAEAERQSQLELQVPVRSRARVQVRSRKRSRTRVAFRMLTPRPALIYTPLNKGLRQPERILNRMTLPTVTGVLLPEQHPKRLGQAHVKLFNETAKRLKKPRAVISRSYSRFKKAESFTNHKRATAVERDVRIISPFKMRRCSSPIRVPPSKLVGEGVVFQTR